MNIGMTGQAVSNTGSITPTKSSVEMAASSTNVPTVGASQVQHVMQLVTNKTAQSTIGEEQLIKAIDRALKAMQGPSTTLDVSVHEKTHAIIVKVLNQDTGEVIREIPPEKTLDIVAKMMEIAGLLIDERV